jgi:hypothetical protein
MFLQKQTAFTGVWEAEVDFEPEEPQQEAGTTVWWSKWSFASIAIRGTESGREVVFRYPNAEGDDFRVSIRPLSRAVLTPKRRNVLPFLHQVRWASKS